MGGSITPYITPPWLLIGPRVSILASDWPRAPHPGSDVMMVWSPTALWSRGQGGPGEGGFTRNSVSVTIYFRAKAMNKINRFCLTQMSYDYLSFISLWQGTVNYVSGSRYAFIFQIILSESKIKFIKRKNVDQGLLPPSSSNDSLAVFITNLFSENKKAKNVTPTESTSSFSPSTHCISRFEIEEKIPSPEKWLLWGRSEYGWSDAAWNSI